jgi:hypothetical protein
LAAIEFNPNQIVQGIARRPARFFGVVLACENRKNAVKSAQSGSSSAVECFLAKEEVAGSNPVFRSSKFVVAAV